MFVQAKKYFRKQNVIHFQIPFFFYQEKKKKKRNNGILKGQINTKGNILKSHWNELQ